MDTPEPSPPGEAPPPGPAPSTPSSAWRPPTRPERRAAARLHLTGVVFFLVLPMLLPLLTWRRRRLDSRYLARQAREALNFQLTLWIGVLLSLPLLYLEVGGYLLIVIVVLGLVMPFAAAEQCREGRDFRYPLILRPVR